MQQYTVEQFLEDVRQEAQALRENATKEELAKLNFDKLRPSRPSGCIYGLMTGHCDSRRGTELIFICCPRYVNNPQSKCTPLKNLVEHVNGSKIKGVESADDFYDHRERGFYHLSAIEAYIMSPEGNNENLISYLKGEIDTLEL